MAFLTKNEINVREISLIINTAAVLSCCTQQGITAKRDSIHIIIVWIRQNNDGECCDG